MPFEEMYQLYDYFMRMAEKKPDSEHDPTWVNDVFAETERKSYLNAAKQIERQLANF